MDRVRERLAGGVVLSELGGYGDGPFCARHGAGADLVMMGTYIVDDGPVDYDYSPAFVFPPEPSLYDRYLQEHAAMARRSGALVGVSAAGTNLGHLLRFFAAARGAGADCLSVCLHSTLRPFADTKTGAFLCHPQRVGLLRSWATRLAGEAPLPLIVKLGLYDTPDAPAALDVLADAGLDAVHVNCEGTGEGAPGLAAIGELKRRVDMLIVSGGIATPASARRVLGAGADAVAIGTGALRDAGCCGRIRAHLNGGH